MGSEMCIRDSLSPAPKDKTVLAAGTNQHDVSCVFVFDINEAKTSGRVYF